MYKFRPNASAHTYKHTHLYSWKNRRHTVITAREEAMLHSCGCTSSHNFRLYHLSPDTPVSRLFVLPLPLSSGEGESLVHIALPHTATAPLVLFVLSPAVSVLFRAGVSSAAVLPLLRVEFANLLSAP